MHRLFSMNQSANRTQHAENKKKKRRRKVNYKHIFNGMYAVYDVNAKVLKDVHSHSVSGSTEHKNVPNLRHINIIRLIRNQFESINYVDVFGCKSSF